MLLRLQQQQKQLLLQKQEKLQKQQRERERKELIRLTKVASAALVLPRAMCTRPH